MTGEFRLYWFTWLDRRWRFGRLWLGVLSFLLVALVLGLLFDLFDDSVPAGIRRSRLGICLFFASINAVAFAGTLAIIDRTQTALDQLRPLLRISDEQFQAVHASMAGAGRWRLMAIAGISLLVGLAHSLAISALVNDAAAIPALGANLGTMLTWFVVLHAITALMFNTHAFARLGRDSLEIDALRPQQVAPFATVALLPSLLLMGTQLFYPLLSLDGRFNAIATLPGFLMTLASAVYLLLRPVWPVHVHMREARASLLASTDAGLARWRERNPDRNYAPESLHDLVPMLTFRQQVQDLPVWPFNLGLLGRWLFYIVIPPLTWVLAALMENFVDTLLA